MENISSNTFLLDLSNELLKAFHSLFSISLAIRNDGIVLPIFFYLSSYIIYLVANKSDSSSLGTHEISNSYITDIVEVQKQDIPPDVNVSTNEYPFFQNGCDRFNTFFSIRGMIFLYSSQLDLTLLYIKILFFINIFVKYVFT